ncbi:MAG: cytochrome c oxidase subunit 4 [Actinomycetota bacterium]
MALSGLAVVAAVIYAFSAKELAGAVMLGVFSVALLYIATVLEHAGPYDHAETDQDAEPELGPEHMLPSTWWPLVMAIGAAATLIGLKFAPVLMGVGAGIFLLAAVGWFVNIQQQHADHGAHGIEGGGPGTHGPGGGH